MTNQPPASLPQTAARTKAAVFSTWFSSPCSPPATKLSRQSLLCEDALHSQWLPADGAGSWVSLQIWTAAGCWRRGAACSRSSALHGSLGCLTCCRGSPWVLALSLCKRKASDPQLLSQQAELQGCAWHLGNAPVTTS